jgi:hypothetical protein
MNVRVGMITSNGEKQLRPRVEGQKNPPEVTHPGRRLVRVFVSLHYLVDGPDSSWTAEIHPKNRCVLIYGGFLHSFL